MSNFVRNTRHPETGKFEGAFWLDDYFGRHHYGVKFKDGTVVDPEKVDLEIDQEEHGMTWEDFRD